jgi:hypothetical protein
MVLADTSKNASPKHRRIRSDLAPCLVHARDSYTFKTAGFDSAGTYSNLIAVSRRKLRFRNAAPSPSLAFHFLALHPKLFWKQHYLAVPVAQDLRPCPTRLRRQGAISTFYRRTSGRKLLQKTRSDYRCWRAGPTRVSTRGSRVQSFRYRDKRSLIIRAMRLFHHHSRIAFISLPKESG